MALVAATLVGCTGDAPPSDAGMDAGIRDAGPPDAGGDAPRRDAPDARLDARADAPYDGGPDDPGWVPLPDLPVDCVVERALHPERLAPIPWEPCAGGPPSCLRADRVAALVHEAWSIEGEIWVARRYVGGVDGLAPIDGLPVAAWREPVVLGDSVCAVMDIATGGESAAVAVGHYSTTDTERSGYSVYAGSRATIGAVETPSARWLGLRFGLPTNLHVSDDAFMYRETTGRLFLYRFDGTWRLMNQMVPGVPDPVMLVGDHVLWQAWTDVSRLAHGSFDITPSVFRDAAPDELRGLATDGETIVWQLASGFIATGVYDRVELWAAPYVRDVATISPRLVRLLNSLETGGVGGRWFAFRETQPDPDELHVVDLADGSLRIFVPPGATNIPNEPILVSEHELLVETTVGFFRVDPYDLPVEP